MSKKMLFIINPKAGKMQIKNELLQILDIFTKKNYEITTYPTQSHGDARNITRKRAKEYDLIVCSGGDGTLNEVISGMMESEKRISIGYIPAGSTNDSTKNLNIPKNVINAANIITEGQTCLYDVGTFNDDYFVYVAGFGIFTDVPYQTKQEIKNVLGYFAYILEGMKRLNKVKPYRLKFEYNDKVLTEDFIFGIITNSKSIGGFKNVIYPDVLLNDGLFEVTLIKSPESPLEYQEILSALIQESDSEHVITFKTNKLVVTGEEKIPWTLDGEFGGEHEKVIINNLKEAVTILVPAK